MVSCQGRPSTPTSQGNPPEFMMSGSDTRGPHCPQSEGERFSAPLGQGGGLQGIHGMAALLAATTSGGSIEVPTGRPRTHLLCDDPVHSGKRLLNLGAIGDILGRELVTAQAAGQLGPELELSQTDLEQLSALRAG